MSTVTIPAGHCNKSYLISEHRDINLFAGMFLVKVFSQLFFLSHIYIYIFPSFTKELYNIWVLVASNEKNFIEIRFGLGKGLEKGTMACS